MVEERLSCWICVVLYAFSLSILLSNCSYFTEILIAVKMKDLAVGIQALGGRG